MLLPTIKRDAATRALESPLCRLAHATRHNLIRILWTTRRRRRHAIHIRHESLDTLSGLGVAAGLGARRHAQDVDPGVGRAVQPGHGRDDGLGLGGSADGACGLQGAEGGAVVLRDDGLDGAHEYVHVLGVEPCFGANERGGDFVRESLVGRISIG